MRKRRGNPHWGKPGSLVAISLSTFEYQVRALGLSPEDYVRSRALKQWVLKNKEHRYVPPELLRAWGFAIDTAA